MGSRILARGWAEKEDLEGEWERVLGISFKMMRLLAKSGNRKIAESNRQERKELNFPEGKFFLFKDVSFSLHFLRIESEEVLPGGDRAAAPAVGTKDTSGRAKFNFLEDTGGRFSLLLPCMNAAENDNDILLNQSNFVEEDQNGCDGERKL
ncbi:hypothetical protein RUM44_000532 [Polyplax serrata]|uniref:Uncharacterized protein n=1 Tax=Polyplax serrata TaxID=468196 RepID=A0ABR1B5R0_POLSC